MLRLLGVLIVSGLLAVLTSAPAVASAEPRLALIITNQSYKGTLLGPLEHPHKDGQILRRALEASGFEVAEPLQDLTEQQMREEIKKFAQRLRDRGPDAVGFFYFSGHGAADGTTSSSKNYLIPIGAPIQKVGDLNLKTIRVDDVQSWIKEGDARITFIIIDACRNLPSWGKGGSKGFAPVRKVAGVVTSFVTQQGEIAADTNVYSNALATAIQRPGIGAEKVFELAATTMKAATRGGQVPELTADEASDDWKKFEFLSSETIDREWDRLRASTDIFDIMGHVLMFPQTPHEKTARERVKALISVHDKHAELRRFADRHRGLEEAGLALHRWRLLDQQGWARAEVKGTKEAFQDYLIDFPEGGRAADAQRKIQQLAAAIAVPPPAPPPVATPVTPPPVVVAPPPPVAAPPCAPPNGQLYRVVVPANDRVGLHMRREPDPKSEPPVATIPPGTIGVGMIGNCVLRGRSQWCQVQYDCLVGYVNTSYLVAEAQPPPVQVAVPPPSSPRYRVTGVRADDVLRMRPDAGDTSSEVGQIPPAATDVERFECRVGPSGTTQWCRVRYRGVEGWVAARYLVPVR